MKGYVLITGATSGIGYALAKVFVQNNYPIILVGRNQEKLDLAKQQLARFNRQVDVISLKQDLSQVLAAEEIYHTLKAQGIIIDILINNAGAGYVGEFIEAEQSKIEELIQLNMANLTRLTYYFAKDMKERGEGKILNVASTGAYHPGAYTAVYYATKAYVLSLSEALYKELKHYGILVSSLCPGATATQFAESAGRSNASFAMPPEKVAKLAYKGLMKRKKVIVPGIANKLLIKVPRGIAAYFVTHYQQKLKV